MLAAGKLLLHSSVVQVRVVAPGDVTKRGKGGTLASRCAIIHRWCSRGTQLHSQGTLTGPAPLCFSKYLLLHFSIPHAPPAVFLSVEG
eukprot:1139767-Pelagomonas_calceolata.AAC.4